MCHPSKAAIMIIYEAYRRVTEEYNGQFLEKCSKEMDVLDRRRHLRRSHHPCPLTFNSRVSCAVYRIIFAPSDERTQLNRTLDPGDRKSLTSSLLTSKKLANGSYLIWWKATRIPITLALLTRTKSTGFYSGLLFIKRHCSWSEHTVATGSCAVRLSEPYDDPSA
jgi:hypothetical protein